MRSEWLSRFPSQAVYGSLWSYHTERLGLRCVHVVVSAETGQPYGHRRTGGVDDTLVLIWAGLPFKCLEGEVLGRSIVKNTKGWCSHTFSTTFCLIFELYGLPMPFLGHKFLEQSLVQGMP